MSTTRQSLLQRLASQFSPGRFGRHLGLQFWQITLETGFRMLATFAAAYLLGPESFGLLGVVMTGVFFFQVSLEGMLPSLIRSISREKAPGEATAPQVAFWGTAGFLLLAFLAGIGVYLLLLGGVIPLSEDLRGLAFLGAALAVVTVAKLVVETALRGLRDYTRAAIVGTIVAPLQAIVCVTALVMGNGLDVYMALLALFMGASTLALIGWFVARHRDAGLLDPPPQLGDQMREMAVYGLPLLFRGFIVFFFFRVNLLIIEAYSPEETGFYAFAERFMLIPILLVGAFLGALYPRISTLHSAGRLEELSGLLARSYTTLLLMLAPCCVVFLLTPWLLTPIFPDYAAAMPMIQLFAPIVVVDAVGYIAVGGLMVFSGHARTAIIFDAFGAVANTAIVWWLVQSHGATGAIIGCLAVHTVYTLVTVPVAFRLARIRLRLAAPSSLAGP